MPKNIIQSPRPGHRTQIRPLDLDSSALNITPFVGKKMGENLCKSDAYLTRTASLYASNTACAFPNR